TPAFPYLLTPRPPAWCTLFPYTTLFRSVAVDAARRLVDGEAADDAVDQADAGQAGLTGGQELHGPAGRGAGQAAEGEHHARGPRSEEHTSELQSRGHLVCRLLLEKKTRV